MKENHIDYVEFKAKDIEAIKKFYTACFDWTFKDFGADYTAFSNSGIRGGFEKTDSEVTNGALVVLYHTNLDHILQKVTDAGGRISKDIFSFPGGRRFHFIDPSNNELAIWSDR